MRTKIEMCDIEDNKMSADNIFMIAEKLIGVCDKLEHIKSSEVIAAISILLIDVSERTDNDVSLIIRNVELEAIRFLEIAHSNSKDTKIKP